MAETFQQYELNAETFTDDNGPVIFLTQPKDYCNEPYKICMHPWQLQAVCEKFGVFEPSDPQSQKTITTLTRRMLVLRERVDHMAYWLAHHSDTQHADLSYEQTYATATADIAGEFCAELQGMQPCTEQPKQASAPVKPSPCIDTGQMSIDV